MPPAFTGRVFSEHERTCAISVFVLSDVTKGLEMGQIPVQTQYSPQNRPWRSRGLDIFLYSFFDIGARWRWVVNAIPWPLCRRKAELLPTAQEAEWSPGPVWTVAENLAPTGILSPDRPTRKIRKSRKQNAVGRTGLCHHIHIYKRTQVYIGFNYSKNLVRSKSEYRPIRPIMSESKIHN